MVIDLQQLVGAAGAEAVAVGHLLEDVLPVVRAALPVARRHPPAGRGGIRWEAAGRQVGWPFVSSFPWIGGRGCIGVLKIIIGPGRTWSALAGHRCLLTAPTGVSPEGVLFGCQIKAPRVSYRGLLGAYLGEEFPCA